MYNRRRYSKVTSHNRLHDNQSIHLQPKYKKYQLWWGHHSSVYKRQFMRKLFKKQRNDRCHKWHVGCRVPMNLDITYGGKNNNTIFDIRCKYRKSWLACDTSGHSKLRKLWDCATTVPRTNNTFCVDFMLGSAFVRTPPMQICMCKSCFHTTDSIIIL